MTKEEEDLIKKAYELGFDRATIIKPAHLIFHKNCPEAKVPATAKIVASQGNLMYERAKGDNNLEYGIGQTCMGIIYQKSSNIWATIIEKSSVSNKNLPPQRLRDFPSSGVCWDFNSELVEYIKKRKDTHINPNVGLKNYAGIAWNNMGCWSVMHSSNQTEYKLAELIPFLPDSNYERFRYPLTPEECYFPEKWCIESKEDNYEMLNAFMHKKSHMWYHYKSTWQVDASHSYFHYPPFCEPMHSTLKPMTGYTLITTQQFITHVLTNTNLKTKENGKQEGGSSIKVQRPDLSIRDTGPIRASGIKCPKSKIQIRDGYSPN